MTILILLVLLSLLAIETVDPQPCDCLVFVSEKPDRWALITERVLFEIMWSMSIPRSMMGAEGRGE